VLSRRRFLGAAGLLGLSAAALAAQQPEGQLPGQGAAGSLRDPYSAGKALDRTTAQDNDAVIQAVEHRLRCPCPCGLDVYTCRTTDFTCSYSPAAHREVLDLFAEGKSPQGIVDAFVARYGEKALMAPPPKGFNLAGYLVPGALVTLAAGVMVLVLRRRAAATPEPRPADPALPSMVPAGSAASVAELDRLRHELEEFDR
jgi:cytochrome c-type biogenesis protein CcmH